MKVTTINVLGEQCSFCDKPNNQKRIVEVIGAGLKARICNECLEKVKKVKPCA